MQKNLLPIGKMAEINHVSITTLRLYDQMGLLKPRYVDPDTGYRYYDWDQNARLDMIAYMKELGVSLKEIGSVLEQGDVALIEQILAQKNEHYHMQMNELRLRHNAVERSIAALERYRKSPLTGTISLEYIDRRLIWGIKCRQNFYAHDIHSYEEMLLELREELQQHGVCHIHSYGVGTSVRQNFIADRIFIFADKQLSDICPGAGVLDSGMYACIYLDRYDDEITYANELLEYCREHNYLPTGDYICEVLTEFNVFDSQKREMFLRLQVPVQFSKNSLTLTRADSL